LSPKTTDRFSFKGLKVMGDPDYTS